MTKTKGAEIMTDYQFKSIIDMVAMIIAQSKDLEDALAKLEKLKEEKK